MADDLRADRYRIRSQEVRGTRLSFVDEDGGGPALLLVHGWPETKRIWWRVIGPLAAAGFRVIVPDLRGFGDSDLPADGYGDVASCSRDLEALVRACGEERVVAVGGDFGGPILLDLSARFDGLVQRQVLFNAPLPYLKGEMDGLRTRPAAESTDYFFRQGTDGDALAAELATPEQRRRYVAQFYGPRFWAHPGAFDEQAVAFMTEPFADAAHLRASFRPYEASLSEAARSEPPMRGRNATHTLILFGPSDHVLYPDFDRMAAVVCPDHVGPFLLRDVGHFVQWEAADRLVGAVRSFCRDLLPAHT